MNHNPLIPCRGKERLALPSRISSTDIGLHDIAGEYTERCFQSCRSCYGNFGPEGKEMTLEQVEEIKRKFDLANITTAHLTGGEILWHRQIEQIIRLFGEAGYRIEIDTNGVLIDQEMAKLLSRFGVDVLVGIETLDPILYHWYRGTDSVDKVLKGLDLMLQQNMRPGIQIIAADFRGYEEEKYDPVGNIFQLIKYFSTKEIPIYLLQYRPLGRATLSRDIVTDLTKEQKTQLKRLINSLPSHQRKLVSGDLPYASSGKADFYGCIGGILLGNMNIEGDIFICNWLRDRKFGNIFQEDLQRIIARMKQFRLDGLEELNCRLQNCGFRESGVCFGPCLVSDTYKEMTNYKGK